MHNEYENEVLSPCFDLGNDLSGNFEIWEYENMRSIGFHFFKVKNKFDQLLNPFQ